MNAEDNKSIMNLTIDAPIIIIGFPRSGANFLSNLLSKYLTILFLDNSIIKKYYDGEMSRAENLNDDVDLIFAIDKIYEKVCIEMLEYDRDFKPDKQQILANISEKNTGGILTSIFNQFTKHRNMAGWGFMTPKQIHTWPVFYNLFPQAKFIHLIRDWRDAPISSGLPGYGADNGKKAATDWKKQIEIANMYKMTLAKNQFWEIRYEDLDNTPEIAIQRLIAFLKVQDRENKLRNRISEAIKNDLPKKGEQTGSKLSEKARSEFDKIGYDYLVKYGYQVSHEEANTTKSKEVNLRANSKIRGNIKIKHPG